MLIITATTWGSYSLVDYSIRNPLIFCVCALMGWYSIMTLAQWIVKHTGRVARFCDRLGERTLSILIFHFCSFKLVSLIIILVYDLPISDLACFPTVAVNNHWWWIAYSVAGVGIPFLAGNYHGAFSRVVSKFGAGRQNNQ